MKTVIIAAALCMCAWTGPVRAQSADLRPVVDRLATGLVHLFDLSRVPSLDPALREQGERLAAEHLRRMRGVIARRLEQDAAELQHRASVATLERRATAWIVNEIATWRLDLLGPEDEARWLRLRRLPGLCRQQGVASRFGVVMLEIQALPAAEREAALAQERERLARWGAVRPGLPSWPDPGPEVQLVQALDEVRRHGEPPQPAMSPVLHDLLLHAKAAPDLATEGLRCEALRWWLLRHGDRADALDLARLVLLPRQPAPAAGLRVPQDGYPWEARRFDIQGLTHVEFVLGPEGRPESPRVVGREVSVPGLAGQRPIAFEAVFDDAALARIREQRFSGEPGMVQRVELAWTLQ